MRTAHPREQPGNRLICDSLAISYSRDIDDTIAEEDETAEQEEEEEKENTGSRTSNSRNRRNDGDGDGDDDDAMSNGHAALLEQVVIDRNRRSVSSTSRGRGQSRSVSPGARVAGGQQPQQQHDYVNSAPGSRFLEDNTWAIPAIPPPPQSSAAKFQKQQQQQQFFSVQPAAACADSDPYGKEFDAIGSRVPATATTTTTANPSSTGSRINGRVLPPEIRKEQQAIPPRLRNGFVPGGSGGV